MQKYLKPLALLLSVALTACATFSSARSLEPEHIYPYGNPVVNSYELIEKKLYLKNMQANDWCSFEVKEGNLQINEFENCMLMHDIAMRYDAVVDLVRKYQSQL